MPPAARGPDGGTVAGEVVAQAIRRSVARIADNDPLVRRRERLSDGDTPVHQLRVGCRRLRSDLDTFHPLVDPQWAAGLRQELRWLARRLGAARDVEVQRDRLRATAASPEPLPEPAVARFDEALAARHRRALARLDAALDADRYRRLREALADAAREPRLTALAAAAAREVLPALVAGPWQELAAGAATLGPDATDPHWHRVRVLGKRARYAVEAVAGAIGDPAPALGRRLAAVQELLGEHQDAALAAGIWLAVARAQGGFPAAVSAGRLYERERAAVRRVRDRFPAAWHAASRPRLRSWLP